MTKRRGGTVSNPANTKYSLAEWAKGYAAWLLVFPLYLGLWAFAKVFKRVPAWLHRKLLREWHAETESRKMDVRIPGDLSIPAYMNRWWKIRRNAFFNIYYHLVRRSDEDLALHDHPWWNFSIVLDGGYYEHLILPGGVHTKTWYPAGSVRFRPSGDFAHRLELAQDYARNERGEPAYDEFPVELPVKTIFVTGPVLRRWGFHARDRWVDAYEWDDYCAANGLKAMRMSGYAEQNAKSQS